MEEEIDLVGKAFADHYNHVFDNDRPALSALYKPSSMLTFEGHKIQGVEDITAKLTWQPTVGREEPLYGTARELLRAERNIPPQH
ncbi:hypothetical protein V6N11_047182 [Hibiscus sabdariffa]|uniref:NTF2 domain-containing protein n=1 Tax=Hibiscus sabdariffa TaxID=183260 RepID=A0ABR2A5D9_9ROSI